MKVVLEGEHLVIGLWVRLIWIMLQDNDPKHTRKSNSTYFGSDLIKLQMTIYF